MDPAEPLDAYAGAPAVSTGGRTPGIFAGRNFRLFFTGQLVSNTGNWLQLAAQAILVKELGGSAFVVGAVAAAMFLPVWVFALPGGRLADRFDRRTVLMATQVLAMAATAVLAILAATDHVTITAVMVVAVLVGIQFAISLPTMMALLPALVEPEQLGLAIGMNSITYNVARAIGPAIATLIVATVGFGLTFGLNSLSFLVLFVTVAMLRPASRVAASSSADSGAAGGRSGTTRELFAYAWSERRIRLPLIGMAALAIAFAPIVTLAPTFAHDVFGRQAADAGLLISGFGIGAVAAAIGLTRVLRGHGRARLELLVPAGLLFVAGMVILAFAPTLLFGSAGLAVAGVGYLLSSVTWTTSLQEVVPEHLRGRVMALWALAFLGLWPLAAPVGGLIADAVSPRAAVLALLVPLLVSTLAVVPAARRASSRHR